MTAGKTLTLQIEPEEPEQWSGKLRFSLPQRAGRRNDRSLDRHACGRSPKPGRVRSSICTVVVEAPENQRPVARFRVEVRPRVLRLRPMPRLTAVRGNTLSTTVQADNAASWAGELQFSLKERRRWERPLTRRPAFSRGPCPRTSSPALQLFRGRRRSRRPTCRNLAEHPGAEAPKTFGPPRRAKTGYTDPRQRPAADRCLDRAEGPIEGMAPFCRGLDFLRHGTAVGGYGKTRGAWTVRGKDVRIEWSHKYWATFRRPIDPKDTSGDSWDGANLIHAPPNVRQAAQDAD